MPKARSDRGLTLKLLSAFVLSPLMTVVLIRLFGWPMPSDSIRAWWLYSALAAALVVLLLFARERRWWFTALVWVTSVLTSLVGTAAVVFLSYLLRGDIG